MTDEQVRHAIAETISAATTGATVFEWNALTHDLADWPGLFGPKGSRHGWIIKRSAIDAEWKHGTRERVTWTYDIWGFYSFRTGKTSDNSDDEWSVIVDAVRGGLRAKPTLDLAEVERHELLQVRANTTIDCGEETLHFANCNLQVKICC